MKILILTLVLLSSFAASAANEGEPTTTIGDSSSLVAWGVCGRDCVSVGLPQGFWLKENTKEDPAADEGEPTTTIGDSSSLVAWGVCGRDCVSVGLPQGFWLKENTKEDPAADEREQTYSVGASSPAPATSSLFNPEVVGSEPSSEAWAGCWPGIPCVASNGENKESEPAPTFGSPSH